MVCISKYGRSSVLTTAQLQTIHSNEKRFWRYEWADYSLNILFQSDSYEFFTKEMDIRRRFKFAY